MKFDLLNQEIKVFCKIMRLKPKILSNVDSHLDAVVRRRTEFLNFRILIRK